MHRTFLALGALGLMTGAARPGGSLSHRPVPADSFDLVVAATTDVHGRVRGWDYYGNRPDPMRGLTRAATIATVQTIHVSAAIASTTRGRIIAILRTVRRRTSPTGRT